MQPFISLFFASALAAPVAAPIPSVEIVEGVIGPGAKYALYCPSDWNGDLILYAHGYIDAEAPIDLPTLDLIEPLRDELVDGGYAVAYSSYSENGLAIKDGAQRTKQLRGIFTSEFGKPDRIFLMGHSLGGLVALKLVEKYPQHYDGALLMSGLLGGTRAEVDYVANVRILWDLFYPGVLPGNVLDFPPDLDLYSEVIVPIVMAISAEPTGAVLISAVDQTPVPWSTPEQLVESFVRVLGFHARGFNDLIDRTHGHSPVNNVDTVYSGLLPDAVLGMINAGVGRYESTPDAENYMEKYYEPTGELGIPILTLHNDQDPVSPLLHEDLYRGIVAAAGCSEFLVQRTVERYGHCEFEVAEMVQAVEDLVNWVDTGVAPMP